MYHFNITQYRIGCYVRKSQEDQGRQIQSIESQIDVLTDMEKREEFKISKVYKDRASAYIPSNRIGFSRLLQDIHEGKIDGILCWKADRLARNHIEGGMILHCLEKGILKFIKTPDKIYLPTDNVLPLAIEFGMSNQQSRDISVNVKRGNKTKINNGGWCGVAPHGYINNVIDKTIEIDPDRFDIVRKFWDLFLTNNYSLQQICEVADKLGFKTIRKKRIGGVPLSLSTLHGILVNPFYYGKVKNGSNEGTGNHKAMITYMEFQKVQEILKARGRKSKTSCSFLYTGLFRCGQCDGGITAEKKVKYKCSKCKKRQTAKHPKVCSCGYHITSADINKGKFYTYYHCSKSRDKCQQKSITEENLEKEILTFLKRFTFDEDFIRWSEKWFLFIEDQLVKNKDKEVQQQKKKYEKLKQQRLRLVDLRLEREIDEDLFKEKKKMLEAEIATIEYDSSSITTITEVRKVLSFLEGLYQNFLSYPPKEKKILLNKISSNHILMDKKVLTQGKKAYILLDNLREHKSLRIEPPKSQSKKDLNEPSKECYSTWQALLKEFRTTHY